MNQKQIGILLIIAGILVGAIVYAAKLREDRIIAEIINETNSCYLSDGTCLHENRDYTLYIGGGAVSISLLVLGFYLMMFEKSHEKISEENKIIAEALKDAKQNEKKKDEFSAFLAGFSTEEQIILKAVHDQDGILQSTLRYRTGMSKTTLSLMLKSLEERGFISRKESGKTNKVFLRKRF